LFTDVGNKNTDVSRVVFPPTGKINMGKHSSLFRPDVSAAVKKVFHLLIDVFLFRRRVVEIVNVWVRRSDVFVQRRLVRKEKAEKFELSYKTFKGVINTLYSKMMFLVLRQVFFFY
jgi:hypothetical protein